MPSTGLSIDVTLSGTNRLTRTGTVETSASNVNFGQGAWDAMRLQLSYGSSSSQAEEWYAAERTVTATTADNLDLFGSLTNPWGETLNFTHVKFLAVAIDSPDGTKSLRVGPRGVSNAWQGPWGGTGATDYKTVWDWEILVNNKWSGVAVTSGTADILGIYNPGAGSVTYRILIVGLV